MGNIKVLVGRSSQCDYTIADAEQYGNVSGKHATISEMGIPNTYLFEDHSTNGSYVNGRLLHNNSCKITIRDHITLGKTYTLPLADIVNRYFTERLTTKKKPQGIKPQPQVVEYDNEVTRPLSSLEETVGSSSNTPNPKPYVVTETITIEKVPDWFWVLYGVSVLIAFAVGFLIYDYIY